MTWCSIPADCSRAQLEYSSAELEYSSAQLEYSSAQLEYSSAQLEYSGAPLENSSHQLELGTSSIRTNCTSNHFIRVHLSQPNIPCKHFDWKFQWILLRIHYLLGGSTYTNISSGVTLNERDIVKRVQTGFFTELKVTHHLLCTSSKGLNTCWVKIFLDSSCW